jgi:5-methyltetrahydrofolate--homocysteine methyltransferase
MSNLLDGERRQSLDAENRELQERLRVQHAERVRKPLLAFAVARANPHTVDFSDLPVPAFSGRRVVDADLATLREYIDWQFFFHAWELKGKFPAILEQPVARDLWDDAQELLTEIVDDGAIRGRGVYGFWPAMSDGDTIVVSGDNGEEITRFELLRQQADYGDARPNRSLADYVSPGPGDWIGAFAVTAGLGAGEVAARYERDHDDYRAIMVRALADRLAEAFAEYLHEAARRDWYDAGPKVSNEDLVAERYRGIRPAFGYPACPDHSEKPKLFDLLRAEEVGLELTETFAMLPAASVSGIYLQHPEARYFSVGRIGRDQVEDYAARKGMTVREVERWLAPNLGYAPEAEPAAVGS